MAGSRIRDVVPEVVADRAPAETVIVDGLLELDDDAIVRRLEGRRRVSEDPLGYGAADVAVLVTPVLWLTLDKVREKLAEVAADGTARGVGVVIRRVLHRKAPAHGAGRADLRRRVPRRGLAARRRLLRCPRPGGRRVLEPLRRRGLERFRQLRRRSPRRGRERESGAGSIKRYRCAG
jgi:hypothetical protein